MEPNGRPWSIFYWMRISVFRHRDHCEHTWLLYAVQIIRVQYARIFFALLSVDWPKDASFFSSLLLRLLSFCIGLVWFFRVCVWVSFCLRVLLLSNVSMLMIRIILWEKNEKRIKSWSAKLDAIGLISSVMLFPFRLMPPIDRNLQSDEIRLQCAGPGHRLPHTKIHTHAHTHDCSEKKEQDFV